jgi:bile acid transporter
MTLSGMDTLLMPVFMFLLMLGMGATLTADPFRLVLRKPVPVLIGLASQYGWMPLIAMILALVLNLPPAMAVGLIIMGCTAGGPISNFFTYIGRGDLALSISMTLVSTVTGFLMIPFMLLIYTAPFLHSSGDHNLNIPLGKIIVTLFVILIPVGLGMLVRKRSHLWARRVEVGGTVAGLLLIILIIANTLLREAGAMLQINPSVYLAAIMLGPIGFTMGYLSARVLGLELPQRHAVSLETGLQNVPLAMAIILISFPGDIQSEILVVPIFYGIVITPLAALTALLMRNRGHARVSPRIRNPDQS